MNPSEYEIQREVEALRDIRRRSAAPGALTIDPDLPTSSSQNPYWASSPSTENDSSSSSSHDDGSNSSHTDATSHKDDDPLHLFWVPASVHPEIAPAEFRAFLKEHSRSPPPTDGASPSRSSSLSSVSGLDRKRSMLSRQYKPSENDGVGEQEETIVPLRRNRSYLYHSQGPQLTISDLQRLEQLAEEASENDDPTKLRTMLRRSLSLNISPTALDKMDRVPDMADEADAPIIIPPPNSIVRRTARTTKFRKPSLLGGEGDSSRGTSRRRGTTRISSSGRPSSDQGDHTEPLPHKRVQSLTESNKDQRTSQDSFDEALIYDAYVRDDDEELQPSIPIPKSTSPPPAEPSTFPASLPEYQSSPSLIEALEPILHSPEPSRPATSPPSTEPPPPRSPSPPALQGTSPPSPPPQVPKQPTSPPSQQRPPVEQQPSFLDTPPTPEQVPPPRKEKKSQKGLFKWGSDKSSKKHAKEAKEAKESKESAGQPPEPKEPKEKESGFFGSLFSKKSKDSSSSSSHGHDTAPSQKDGGASLGVNKNQQPTSPATPGFGTPAPGGGIINNYSRYPLHVERAIYRLSHIKLANPRRPLYEQVLISNLMFWYLGVINRAQGQQQQQQQQQQQEAQQQGVTGGPQQPPQGPPNPNGSTVPEGERESMDEQQRNSDQERMDMQHQHQQHQQQQQHHMDVRQNGTYNSTNNNTGNKRESSPKRGSLTKAAPAGQGGRRGEMVVKGPQYDMQHRAMEQEYGAYGQPQQMGRGGGPPSQSWGYQQQQQQQQSGPPNNQPPRLVQQQHDENPFYYSVDMVQQPQPQQRLPPGAMAPLDQSNWSSGGDVHQPQPRSPPPQRQPSPSSGSTGSPQRRSRSPPPQVPYSSSQQGLVFPGSPEIGSDGGRQNANGGHGFTQQQQQQPHRPVRSLSATALSSGSPSTNGKVKKGTSAHAAVPSHRGRPRSSEGKTEKLVLGDGIAEEEDVPLAVYQQHRRR
ncbi:hypothetical protein PM082_010439 [Marasmius tenuissimus]|nr:hypothetical protein PM082_010439 [Marasmius tenuissimus]